MKKFLVTVVMMAGLGFGATAMADPVRVSPVATLNLGYGQGSMRATVSGSYAYTAYNGFQVYDLSNPVAPVRLATLPSASGRDLVSFGRYAFVGGPYDLNVIDVVDPASPVLVNTLSGLGGNRMALSNNYILVAAGTDSASSSLKVLDFSTPTAPVQVASLTLPDVPTGIAVSGKFAYITLGSGILVVDVSRPTVPCQVATLALADTAYGIDVSGSYAYVTTHGVYCDYEEVCTLTSRYLYVVDISNPLCPKVASSVLTRKAAEDIVISGQYAYIVEKSVDYFGGHWNFLAVDIVNPLTPQIAAYYQSNILNSGAQGLAVMGDYVFQPISTGALVFQALGSTTPVPACTP